MIKSLKTVFLFSKLIGSVFLLLLMKLPCAAQTDNAGFIQKQFEKYNEQSLQEKVFVHVDRSFYLAGEIIWFKIYCTDANSNSLLHLSKVAYVEVLDKDQQPVLQAKIALKDGVGDGSLLLPATIRSGNFLFRAYTSLMKNGDPEFYYHQNLSIINTIQNDTLPAKRTAEIFEATFFPEGGNLVDQLKSKVAFRVSDKSGRGTDCNGIIVNENNDTLLRFRSLRFGIGSFIFTPRKDKNYKAIITTATGTTITQNLPPVLTRGYVMNVSDQPKNGQLKIGVQTNTDSRWTYLFIHSAQQVKATRLLTFLDGKADFEIDLASLGEGISHITLFDVNNQPVAERLYFKRPKQQLFIDAVSDNSQYQPRKKVNISLSSKDENNKLLAAEMSMAVYRTDSLPLSYKDIFSYLRMSSDLKGKVDSPEYYFNNNSSEADEATDNLMLTHGWRRFKWEDILAGKKVALKFLPEYEGHIVSAKIIRRSTETAVENKVAFLSVPGSHFQLYSAKSSSDGTVHFNTKDFFGNKLIVAQTYSDTNQYRIDLADPFSDKFSSQKVPPFALAATNFSELLKRSIRMQVQNIYTGSRLNTFEALQTDTATFYGKATAKYMLDDYTRFPTMEEVLREYVQELNVKKRRDNFFLTMVDKEEEGNAKIKNPVILLDGVPQFDNGNKITHYDALKVRKLEIVKQTYFLGPAKFDGIASFSTYNGDLEGFQIDSASTVIDYDALQLRREFYSPAYETTEQYSSRLPDFRSLLYWSPGVKTKADGNTEISFYTSDLPGKYAVVLQGISPQGKSASKAFTFEVRKNFADKK